ncbi:hypothetical protein [Nitrosomonas europaea]|uniref:hypothetical protein n=1 Tax=Nitrosomonas europaea TaxID=915 RepID=UPI000A869FE7|nr:hypothetical protein [Nitrosomonas sp.]
MKKTAFILSVILILLVAVMALIALFSEIEGDNVRHGIMGAGISTLPLVAYCISVVRVRRGWYLVAATLNGLFFALALAMVLIVIILMDDPSMMKNLLSVLLILLVPLTLNICADTHTANRLQADASSGYSWRSGREESGRSGRMADSCRFECRSVAICDRRQNL